MNNSNKNKFDMKAVGDRIREERMKKEWSRETLAEKAEISPRYFAEIERGEKMISVSKFYNIVKALDVSADYMLSLKPKVDLEECERERLRESILEPLKKCNKEQLRCMERISRSYVKGLAAKDDE